MDIRELDKLHFRSFGDASLSKDAVFADGCAHRDRQFAAWLRRRGDACTERGDHAQAEVYYLTAELVIERGEHVHGE